jgi:hypothetical protein
MNTTNTNKAIEIGKSIYEIGLKKTIKTHEIFNRSNELLNRSNEIFNRSNELLNRSNELLNRSNELNENENGNQNNDNLIPPTIMGIGQVITLI